MENSIGSADTFAVAVVVVVVFVDDVVGEDNNVDDTDDAVSLLDMVVFSELWSARTYPLLSAARSFISINDASVLVASRLPVLSVWIGWDTLIALASKFIASGVKCCIDTDKVLAAIRTTSIATIPTTDVPDMTTFRSIVMIGWLRMGFAKKRQQNTAKPLHSRQYHHS